MQKRRGKKSLFFMQCLVSAVLLFAVPLAYHFLPVSTDAIARALTESIDISIVYDGLQTYIGQK